MKFQGAVALMVAKSTENNFDSLEIFVVHLGFIAKHHLKMKLKS